MHPRSLRRKAVVVCLLAALILLPSASIPASPPSPKAETKTEAKSPGLWAWISGWFDFVNTLETFTPTDGSYDTDGTVTTQINNEPPPSSANGEDPDGGSGDDGSYAGLDPNG